MKITRDDKSKPTAEEWRIKTEELIKDMYDLGHRFDWEYNNNGQVHTYQINLDAFINTEFDNLQRYLTEKGWNNITKDKKSIKATDGDDYIQLNVKRRLSSPTNEIASEHFIINDLELIINIQKEKIQFDIEVKSDFQMIKQWKIHNDKLRLGYGISTQAEWWKSEYEKVQSIREANQQIIDKKSYNFNLIYKKDRYDRDEEPKFISSIVDIVNMLES